MIQKLKNIIKTDFIKSSSLVFIVNNFNNVLSYVLIVIVIFYLKDDFGQWASITGILAVLAVPMSSFITMITRQVSVISEDQNANLRSFYQKIINSIRSIWLYILLAVFALYILILSILKIDSLIFAAIIIISVLTTLLSSIHQNFLLGLMAIPKYATTNIYNSIVKFGSTIGLLFLNFGVLSLPLGIIFSSLSSFVLARIYLKKYFKDSDILPISKYDTDSIYAENLKKMWVSMYYFMFLALLINVDIILSRTFLTQEQNNQYGIISTFGQIAHFGPISFASILVPYTSRNNHKDFLKISLISVTFLSFVVGLGFALFGNLILSSFNKSAYLSLLPLIALYSIFILFYNVCFVTVNYLISRQNYIPIKWILFIVSIYVFVFSILAISNFADFYSQMMYLIISSIFFSFISLMVLLKTSLKEI